ncbi:uncharacterized protein C9orf85 homolog [Silurus meridionalis]|uniref:Uncharacterized protein n=1 Tax=Silurus meridionalis TaxID=175797 RepID=A0A8T0A6X6_SILME|nr:uncharacterized protein C9orf85 homolog [Silurus meridionalis]KAF7687628.1 hypothetical protein HF521_014856 [Silurus meridionalis]KAI5091331.1 hypothetical protein C0J45_18537 [Silurus meridionalis]
MSSQKGSGSRARAQKFQNATAFKNDKYGASPQVKKANAKVHDGVCQRCKEILEWKVKYNKYKSLTQPRKCVKCLQKTVTDAYYVMCRSCALQLQLCAKCGKSEEVVIPLDKKEEVMEEEEPKGNRRRKKGDAHEPDEEDDLDDFGELDSDCESEETEK